jgi:hypothetical protein
MTDDADEVQEDRRIVRGRPRERAMERTAFRNLIDNLSSSADIEAAQKIWLKRFLSEVQRRRALEKHYRQLFWITQFAALGGAVALPPLVTASSSVPWLRGLTIGISLIVALATVAERIFRLGPRWRLYRWGADTLVQEGFSFFEALGPYNGLAPLTGLPLFIQRVEVLIADFQRLYLLDLDAVLPRQGTSGSHDGNVNNESSPMSPPTLPVPDKTN